MVKSIMAITMQISFVLLSKVLFSVTKELSDKERFKIGGQTFSVHYDTVDWREAYKRCEAMGKNTRLAVLDDPAEFDKYMRGKYKSSLLFTTCQKGFWLSANDIHHEGAWIWGSSGCEMKKTDIPWPDGEPNNDPRLDGGDCLEWGCKRTFNDYGCLVTKGYICEHNSNNNWRKCPKPPIKTEQADCTPAACRYNDQTGICSSTDIRDHIEVGSQQCRGGCSHSCFCYITQIRDQNAIDIIDRRYEMNDAKCDYSTFSSSHTMIKYTGPHPSCGAYHDYKVTEDDIKTILKTHNDLRDKVAKGKETRGEPGPQPGATNMFQLKWNSELAEVAQRWAEQCKLAHDDDRKVCSHDYDIGQNVFMAWNFNPESAWEKAITAWYNEVKDFPSSLVGSMAPHPTGKDIGHYTQVVWAGTYEVGCGGIHFPSTLLGISYAQSKVYVCNYGPGGNLRGAEIYESGSAATKCSNGVSAEYLGLCAPPS